MIGFFMRWRIILHDLSTEDTICGVKLPFADYNEPPNCEHKCGNQIFIIIRKMPLQFLEKLYATRLR